LLIFFVTNSLWDEPHRGRHHLANLLSTNHTVIWVNRQLRRSESGPKRGLERRNTNLYILHTGYRNLPNRIVSFANLNNLYRLKLVRKEVAKIGFVSPPDLLWITDPKATPFALYYQALSKSLYFSNDYFGEYIFYNFETKLSSLVDHVICTSPKLLERLGKFNDKTVFIPHGVWPRAFTSPYNKKDVPKIAGYIGTFRNVLDITFFQQIIEETDLKLLLAGPIIECSVEKTRSFIDLFEHKRVEYLGNLDVPASERAISKLDIGLLPYIRSFKTQHNFVLKYFEYLAAGKPIVATPYFQWPFPYSNFVHVYNRECNLGSFFSNVYANWDEHYYLKALELSSESTWQKRIEQVGNVLGVSL
jgi:glycosyltransferase involved in cell wall biosynthesis